jgi:hypothetical protein
MTTASALLDWINPRHLHDHSVREYRDIFASHPARLVVLKEVLTATAAAQLSEFLRNEASFQLAYGLYSAHHGSVSSNEWTNATDGDRFFRFAKLVGASGNHSLTSNLIAYLRFRKAFQTPPFRDFFEKLCGMQLAWSDSFGAHSMASGDFLKLHNDSNGNRRLALVFYLSPDWESAFGGALIVVDENGSETRIEAEYNSMIAFDVTAGTKHFIEPIHPASGGRARLTISGWYDKADHVEDQIFKDLLRTDDIN